MSSSHEEQLLDDFLEHYALDTIYTDMTVEEYFEHFGVKGMKWGVRKDTRGQGLTAWMIKDGASKADMNGLKRAIARVDGAARVGVHTTNQKYRGVNLRTDAKARKKYNAEINQVFKRQYPKGLEMFGIYSVASTAVAVAPAIGLPVSVALIITRSRQFKNERAAVLAQSDAMASEDEFTIMFDFVLDVNGLIEDIVPRDPDILEHSLEMTAEEFLAHYGVKGMRWGVRRAGDTSASSIDRASARYNATKVGKVTNNITRALDSAPATVVRAAIGVAVPPLVVNHIVRAAWANRDNRHRINNKPEYKGKNLKKNPELRKKYNKEQQDAFKKALMDPRGMRLAETKLRVSGEAGSTHWRVTVVTGKDLHHADDNTIIVDLEYDDMGFIIDMKVAEPLKHMEDLDDATIDFLAHYGVLGMRWGKRKGDSSSGGSDGGSGGTSGSSTHEEHIKVQALRKKKISELSTAEMKLVTDRMNTEKKYRELNPSDHELLMRRLKKHASTATKVIAFMATPNGKLLMKSMGFDVDTKRAEIKLKEQAKKDAAKEKKQSSKATARAAEKKRVEDNKRSTSAADIADLRERAKRP